MMSTPSDARLARRAGDGDERAFAAIFRRYHQELYRFCLSILSRPEDAQEALQNTMVKALRALPGEKREIRLKPWLYRVAHNESIDLLRRRREGPELDAVQASAASEIAETVELRERLSRLLGDLAELPARQRSALVMRELAGLDYRQIAEAFETSTSVARQTVYEARLGLRALEAGREMGCEEVTRRLSEADGRTLRRRDIHAHLRSCADCRAFRDAIPRRREDLAALAPLPAVAAAAILHGVAAGGSAATGSGVAGAGAAGVGAGTSKAAATSLTLKAVATVAVVATVGATAADRGGLVDLGFSGANGSGPAAVGHAAKGSTTGTGRNTVHVARPAAKDGGASVSIRRAAIARHRVLARHASGGGDTLEFNPAPNDSKPGPPHPGEGPPTLPAASNHGQETAAAHKAHGNDNPGQAHRHEPPARGHEARNGAHGHGAPAKGKTGEPGKGGGKGETHPKPRGKGHGKGKSGLESSGKGGGREKNNPESQGKGSGKGQGNPESPSEDSATSSPDLSGEPADGTAAEHGHKNAASP